MFSGASIFFLSVKLFKFVDNDGMMYYICCFLRNKIYEKVHYGHLHHIYLLLHTVEAINIVLNFVLTSVEVIRY